MNREISRKINSYLHGAELLRDLMEGIPEAAWSWKPPDGGWCIAEIVHHLADSEVFGYIRLRKLVAENGSRLETFDQEAWTEELKYRETEPRLGLELYLMLNRLNAALLNRLPDIVWNTHAVIHPERGSLTLADWLDLYESHLHTHIEQIRRTFTAWQGA